MSDESSAQTGAPAAAVAQTSEATAAPVETPAQPAAVSEAKEAEPKPAAEQPDTVAAPEAPAKEAEPTKPAEENTAAPSDKEAEKPVAGGDVEMKDAAEPAKPEGTDEAATNEEPEKTDDTAATSETPVTPADKGKARRKSAVASEQKGKKLNKKASKAKILHLDAKPGDYFFVRLKGYPPWPCIICDEEMLPQTLTRSRPVTACRPDGTYREDYADGGKRAQDRTFPVMYLHTNEFGWVPNSDLHDLDPEKVVDLINPKMRKDLVAAHNLAAEQHDLDYFKGVLQRFQEDLLEKERAREAAREAKAAATPAKKPRKSGISAAVETDADEDIEMADAGDDETSSKSKKRKAEEANRTDSVKKPKIKLTNNASTPKAANGVPTPKSAKSQGEGKPAKAKSVKKAKDTQEKKAEVQPPKEPELSPEEKHHRKEKEVLFLRHKLQKGLLTRDQEPKEEEMKTMSDFITKLEGFPDLEVSIIRATKINKVLKAILKLENIPKEEEFQFKPRSQVLLDKWNKLLAVDGAPAPAGSSDHPNGVNGTSAEAPVKKEAKAVNGVKENGKPDTKAEAAKDDDDVVSKPADAAAPEKPVSETKTETAEAPKVETTETTA